MVHIPAGPFVMGFSGESDAEPERGVTLDDYWIAKYPVTVAQFGRFVDSTGYKTDAERGAGAWQWNGYVPETPDPERDSWDLTREGRWNNIFFPQGDDHPVGSVSWNDAQVYCSWLSEQIGLPVRRGRESGLSLEEIQRQGLPDLYPEWLKTGYTDADETRRCP